MDQYSTMHDILDYLSEKDLLGELESPFDQRAIEDHIADLIDDHGYERYYEGQEAGYSEGYNDGHNDGYDEGIVEGSES